MIKRATQSALMWLARLLLSVASHIVPRCLRAEWLAEWRGELVYLADRHDAELSRVLTFVWGSLPDAVTVRQIHPVAGCRVWDKAFSSPLRCLGSLSALASLAFVACVAGRNTGFSAPDGALPHVFMICLAILASFIRNSAIIAGPSSTTDHVRQRVFGWLFLLCKAVLALAIAGCTTAVVLRPLSYGTVHAHAYLLPYVFACRWSILEQAKRCPICLCRMSNPVQIGSRPTMLLDWFGMEYMCRQGHGFMYEPIVEGAFCSRRWTPLDQSWKDLFAQASSPPAA